MFRASVAELADAPDLGSGGFTVGVQVPSLAPFLCLDIDISRPLRAAYFFSFCTS